MNRHQQHLFQLLCEIRDICDANGITYYLIGGTLIGAVRNRGFLPWDDDADIAMTYADWVKFDEVCKTQLPPNRYLGSPTDDESYGHLLPRYMSTDTTLIHSAQSLNDCVSGIVIDIFVLDPIADDEQAYADYLQDMFLMSTLANYANVAAYRAELDPDLFKKHLEMAHQQGKAPVISQIEQRMANRFVDEGRYYAYRWQNVPYRLERSWFGKGQTVEFEGQKFTAPQDINGNLTAYFGEKWPEVPPTVNPAKHDAAMSLDIPYAEALEHYHPTYDRTVLIRETEERRYSVLKHAKTSNALRDERIYAKSNLVALDVAAAIEEHQAEYDAALAAEDGATLAALLADYLSWQTGSLAIGRRTNRDYYRFTKPILVEVDDTVFEAALVALLHTDRVHHASRLIEVREELGGTLTPAMQAIRNDICALRESMSCWEKKRYLEGREKAMAIAEANPCVSWYWEVACLNAVGQWRSTNADEDLETYEALADSAIDRFPANGAFRKAKADCLEARGHAQEAHELYLHAAEMTRNGLVLLDIADVTGYHPRWLRSPEWAKTAKVPQWNGPEPGPLPITEKSGNPVRSNVQINGVLKCLGGLLAELAALCDDERIDYVLSPALVDALTRTGQLPARPEDYAIVCSPNDMQRLVELLLEATGKNPDRSLSYIGNNSASAAFSLRYQGTDSIHVALKGSSDTPHTRLCITVVPLEPKTYGGRLAKILRRWKKGVLAVRRPDTAQARAYAAAHTVVAIGNRLGRLMFSRAMLQAQKTKKPHVFLGKKLAFDPSYLRDRVQLSCEAGTFWVPADRQAYVRDFKKCCGIASEDYAATTTLTSAHVNYQALVDFGLFDNTYFTRRAQYTAQTKQERETLRRFRQNFQEIKDAVDHEAHVRAVAAKAPVWARSGLISHAGGGIDKTAYTNSAEALAQTLESTHSVVEMDFMFTTDDVLVCEHGWKRNGRVPQSSEEFLSTRIAGRFTPMTAEAACDMLCNAKRDIDLVVDSQEKDIAKVHERLVALFRARGDAGEEFLHRVIPEIYHEPEYDAVHAVYPYENWTMSLYKKKMKKVGDFERMAEFCRDHGIGVLIMAKKRLSPEVVSAVRAKGVSVAAHTVNTVEEQERYQAMGVVTFFTDYLAPARRRAD